MSTARTIPNPATHDVVTFDILVNDEPINPGLQVMSISVSNEINRVPTARIILRDGEAPDETFEISNQDYFVPGNEIAIKLGRDRINETVFQGIVTKHAIRIRENGQSDLVVECKDKSIKLTIGRHSRYFENSSDSQTIEEIVSSYNDLSVDINATSLTHKELVQHHATDWDFILSRADANGLLVSAKNGTLTIAAPDSNQEPALALLYGATILEFEAEMDARNQWNSVNARSWNYSNQSLFEAETSDAGFSANGNIDSSKLAAAINLQKYELSHSGQVLEEELQQWVNAGMLKSRLAKIRGRARIRVGSSQITAGNLVELQGVGNRFNGNAFVSAVKHEVGNGQWDTHIQFGLCPEWFAQREDIIDFPAAGLIPSIHGLQIGKVVQLQNDPDEEDRIKVRLPVIDANAEGIWCRVATLDAGNNRGSFFRPEIDDEVIIGFVNDDPRDAIVLGHLHSSAKPAPLTASDDNHEKGFFTRSGMRIHFHDNDKTITIDTPAGNKIIMDEAGKKIEIEDQNSNSIKMEASGIKIKSPKEISLEAGTMLSLKANTSLSISAVQLSAKADGPISLEGATAKLSSPGITELTGSLVKIN